jgi:AcrR family transcriptional regulator
MNPMSGRVKRPYRSALRDQSAQVTRQRVRAAAAELFVEQGFVATTMKQVADRAGVAERTVYTAFPTKAQLFLEVVGVATVGDDRPVPVAEREEVRAALAEPDGRRALELVVDYSVAIHERAADLIMAGELSSGADPDMRRFSEEGAAAMASDVGLFARALAERGTLVPGVDAGRAPDVLFTLLSPHVHHLLRRLRGWTLEQYRDWVLETLVTQLLISPDADG